MTDRVLAFKESVSLVGLQPEALIGVDKCLDVFHEAGLSMTLTAGRDWEHDDHSHHFKGLGWDIRIWEIRGRTDWMCGKLREKLGSGYQVVNEEDHIHVEFDPKRKPEDV